MATQQQGKGFGFLFEMGCGKTLTAIAVAGAGYQMGKVKRVLIVAPTSVCAVWPKEFQDYAAFPYTIRTMLGTKAQRLKELADLERFPYPHLKVAVINYESTWREDIIDALVGFDADLIIADESQRIKTHDAAQSKAMHQLGDKARYKLILSGTPVQNEAIDIFSQYRFLDPSVFGLNFYAFRGRYCEMGGFNRKQIVRYRDLDQLIKKEHSIAYRVTKEEAGGFLVEDDADKPRLVSRGKLDALEDILQDYVVEGKKKLVIFARFLPEIHEIEALCQKVLGRAGMSAVAIYGEIKKEDRGSIVQRFQTDPDTTVFIGQIDTAGTGITLTAADTCVFYSVNFNYATYSQSLSRIHRIGQRNRCTYIHLVVEKTVDDTILNALAKKEDLAKTVVDTWRDYF